MQLVNQNWQCNFFCVKLEVVVKKALFLYKGVDKTTREERRSAHEDGNYDSRGI